MKLILLHQNTIVLNVSSREDEADFLGLDKLEKLGDAIAISNLKLSITRSITHSLTQTLTDRDNC